MTELADLLEAAAPDVRLLDVAAIEARVRRRRQRRIAIRSGVAALVVLAIVGSVVVLQSGPGARQVDVGGGPHPTSAPTTTGGRTSLTTTPPTSALPAPSTEPAALPGPGAVVDPRWLIGADMITTRSGVGVVSAQVTCGDTCDPRIANWPVELATTADGGATWRAEGAHLLTGPLDYGPASAAFDSTARGDVLIGGTVWVTSDGGSHWSRLQAPGAVTAISRSGGSVWAVSARCEAGVVSTTTCPTVLLTVTTGVATPAAQRPIPAETSGLQGRQAGLRARPAPTTGVFVEGADGPVHALLMTTDSGRTWHQLSNPCGDLIPSQVAAPSTGGWWLLCELGSGMNQGTVQLFRSSDAGGSWSRVASADPTHAHAPGALGDGIVATMAASGNGGIVWLVDLDGIQVSTDGGAHWHTANAALDGGGNEATVSTSGATSAWLVAIGSGLWRTTDGLTWQQ